VATRPRPRPTPVTQPADDEPLRGPGDPALWQTLAGAQQAYDRGEWVVAGRLANDVIDTKQASDRQLFRAHALQGAIECRARNSQGGALGHFRQTRGKPRRWLVERCAAVGITLEE
nr:hypothetical protein [Myxococcota bacterium]